MSNQYLSFDVTKQSAPQQLITGRQGDSQLKFASVLLWDSDKNIPYDLTGKQIAFEALKPDGTHIVDYAGVTILDARHGLFRYSFNEQVFAVSGTMQQAFFKITHTDKDNQVIADSTLEINIHILENRVEFGINSTDYLSEYDDLITKVKQKFDDYVATVQDSIDKATALHDQIVAYTQLINDKQVLTLDEFNAKITPFGSPDSLDIHVDDGVTNIFEKPLDAFKATINKDDKVAKIALIQDLHFQRDVYPDEYGTAATKGLEQLQHIGRLEDKLDVVVNNGDLVHGHELKDGTEKRIKQLVATEKMFFKQPKIMYTIGNHDDNNIYFFSGLNQTRNALTTNELNNLFKIDKSYSYYDLPDKKLRVIVLSSFENPEVYDNKGVSKYPRNYNSVFSGTQVDWLANEALDVPANFDVVIFTHTPMLGFFGNVPYEKYKNINHDLVLGVLRAFANQSKFSGVGSNDDYPATVTVDFSDKTSNKIAAVIHGHEHHDAETVKDNGMTFVERTCLVATGEGRDINTVKQDAFDIVEVDTVNKTVNFNRFGAVNSLKFSY